MKHVSFLFVLLFSHNLRINMMSKHLFSYSTSKNLENIWLGSQQISTLWMNKPLAATTTKKKSLPLIWYFINSELRFDLLMTPCSKQLDAGQVIQVFACRRIFLCQVGLATPPQKITTVISDHFSQHMLYNQDCTKYLHFNLMQC